MGAQKYSVETNSQATTQGLDQRSKMGEVVPMIACRRAQIQNNPKKVSKILQMMFAGTARRILLPFYPA